MSTANPKEVKLTVPISPYSYKAPISKHFRKRVAVLLTVPILIFLFIEIWGALGLPSLSDYESKFSWPVFAAVVIMYIFVHALSLAFEEESKRRSSLSNQKIIEWLELEVLPHVKSKLVKSDDLPPLDWFSSKLLSKNENDNKAHWGSRYQNSDYFVSYSAWLEDDKSTLKFDVKLPDGIE